MSDQKKKPTEILQGLLNDPSILNIYKKPIEVSVYSAPPFGTDATDFYGDYVTSSTYISPLRSLDEISKLKSDITDWLLDDGEYPDLLTEILPNDCFQDFHTMDSDDANQILERALISLLNWILLRK